VLNAYKDKLPNKDADQEPLPDHKGNPIWVGKWVCVPKKVYLAHALKGRVGMAHGFEEKTGRYLVHFEEGVGERKDFALHPVNIHPVDSKDSECGKKKKKKKKKGKSEDGEAEKKDEL